MIPKCKVEVWQTDALLYTITDDISSLYTKEIVTDGVGHFQFTLPTKKNGGYIYNDIALNDKVKVWLGYDSVGAGDPTFVGKICRIIGPVSVGEGYGRVISGLSQGEVLLRRLKKDKMWWDGTASSIVSTLAGELDLGTDLIEPDPTPIKMEIVTKSYFDALRFVSDYWVDEYTKVQKDFYVDVNNKLVWHSRPFRSTGVETLTVDENIQSYRVYRDITNVKNAIVVYGAYMVDSKYPADGDSKTEQNDAETPQDDGWSAGVVWGSTILPPKVGNEYAQKHVADVTEMDIANTFSSSIKCARKGYAKLRFWISFRTTTTLDEFVLSVGSNSSNFFYKVWNVCDLDPEYTGDWVELDLSIGPDTGFICYGRPDWNTIAYIKFYIGCSSAATIGLLVDGLHFYQMAARGEANDEEESQTIYGRRDVEVSDETLWTDDDCAKRAQALLLQLKEPPIEMEVTVKGNTNILVGDELSLTVPAENLTIVDLFDVVSVEHSFIRDKFSTKAQLIGTANTRSQAAKNMVDLLTQTQKKIRQLGRDEKTI